MRRALPWFFAAALCGGCGSAPETISGHVPVGKPAYVRFLNLTPSVVDGYVGRDVRNRSVPPFAMTVGSIVSAKKQKFQVNAGANPSVVEVAPEPGKYLTIVAAGKSVGTVVGGPCLNPEQGGRIEVANFTAKPVVFRSSGRSETVAPNASEASDVASGDYEVSADGFGPQKLHVLSKEIWLVYLIDANGKPVAKSLRVKGPMQASASGASAAH